MLAYTYISPGKFELIDKPQMLPLPEMYGKNLTFKTGGVDGCDCAEILRLIEAGKIDTTPLITHRYKLADIAEADGLVLGSPIYFGEVTGQMRAFLERLTFPWLSYNDYSMTAPKRIPVVLVETMNGLPERNNSNGLGTMEWCVKAALGEVERITAYNTCQVAHYKNYELGSFSEEAKHVWRDEHWEDDLQKAYDAGRKMAK